MRIALVPVIAGPRLVADEFQHEAFLLRQRHESSGALAAGGNGRVEHRLQLILRDRKFRAEGFQALRQRALPRQQLVNLRHQRHVVSAVMVRGHRIVQQRSLFVEAELAALHHLDAGLHGLELLGQELDAQCFVGATGFLLRDVALGGHDAGLDRRQALLALRRLLLQFRRAVVSVHVAGVMLADGQRQLAVLLRHVLHRRCHGAACHQHGQSSEYDFFHCLLYGLCQSRRV